MLPSSLLRLFQTSVHTRVWIPGSRGHWGALLFLVQLMIPPLTCSPTWDPVVIPASCSLTSPASHSGTEPSRFCLFHISHIFPHAPCCSGRTEGKSIDLSYLISSYLFHHISSWHELYASSILNSPVCHTVVSVSTLSAWWPPPFCEALADPEWNRLLPLCHPCTLHLTIFIHLISLVEEEVLKAGIVFLFLRP